MRGGIDVAAARSAAVAGSAAAARSAAAAIARWGRAALVAAVLGTVVVLSSPGASTPPAGAATGPAATRCAVATGPQAADGYWLAGSDGGVFAYGSAHYEGSMASRRLAAPVVGIAGAGDNGYWLAATDGGVFAFGCAAFAGSMAGQMGGVPISGITATPTGVGYWLVSRQGGVYAFGSARYFGSLPGLGVHVNDIVAMAATEDGGGYWLVGADGGVFAFGDAAYFGNATGNASGNASGIASGNASGTQGSPIVGIAGFYASGTKPGSTEFGAEGGYWIVAANGAVGTFGAAPVWGSMAGTHLNAPMVGVAAVPYTTVCGINAGGTNPAGFWLGAADGGMFGFGDAGFKGTASTTHLAAPIVAIAAVPKNPGAVCPPGYPPF